MANRTSIDPRGRSRVWLLVASLVVAHGAHAVTLGQSDDFEDGTQGWGSAQPFPGQPAQEPDGGPAGAGDGWLRITGAGGDGPGSRISALNSTQWTGDYGGAAAIEVDLQTPTAASLAIRLVFRSGDCQVATATVASLDGFAAWSHFRFPIDLASLTTAFAGACADAAAALAAVDTLQIVHSPEPQGIGFPPIQGVLGVDNLTLLPEPAGAAAAAWGALAWLRGARLRTRSGARRRPDTR